MGIEQIAGALLNVAGVTAIVGARRAVAQLPQGTAMPALVYDAVSNVPVITMNAASGPQLMTSRVQVTALADSADGVQTLLTAVMAAMNLKSGTYAGCIVASVVRDLRTQITKDNDAGVWYASQDFMVHWYE